MDRPAARLTKHSKRVSIPEYPTTALERADAVTDEERPVHPFTGEPIPVPTQMAPDWSKLVREDVVYACAWRHVKGASGTGWERFEFAIPRSLLDTLPRKRFEFDLPRIVQAQTTEFLQNVIEERIDEEYFK